MINSHPVLNDQNLKINSVAECKMKLLYFLSAVGAFTAIVEIKEKATSKSFQII